MDSTIFNGIYIQETYSGEIESSRGGGLSLTKNYILRRKGGSKDAFVDTYSPTREMENYEAYAALQSYILKEKNSLIYQTSDMSLILWATTIKCRVERESYPVYQGTVKWQYDPRKPNYLFQPVTWKHRMVAGTRKVAYSALPQRWHTLVGTAPINYGNGVNWDAKKEVFEGVECYSPEWRMIAQQQILASLFSEEYQLALHSMCPTVNLFPFRGKPPGTVLYIGADVDEGMNGENKVVDLTHQFVLAPNLVNFVYDGIPVPLKEGHEYLWATGYVSENNMPRTDQVNVAPMYFKSDLNLLGLGT